MDVVQGESETYNDYILRLFLEAGVIKTASGTEENSYFTDSIYNRSPIYIDTSAISRNCYLLLKIMGDFGLIFEEKIRRADIIAGIETKGIIFSEAVAKNCCKEHAIIRKEGTGIHQQTILEGYSPNDIDEKEILIIDDVIHTGSSLDHVIESLMQYKPKIYCAAIINRGEGGEKLIKSKYNIEVASLTTITRYSFFNIGLIKKVNPKIANDITAYLTNKREWHEKHNFEYHS